MLAPAPASAGAWIAPEGGQEIWTNAAGKRGDVGFVESSIYWEMPVGDDVSFVSSSWIEQGLGAGDEDWRAEASLGVKASVFRTERAVMAVQAGAVWLSAPEDECGEAGAEVRWLGGMSFGERGRGFVNLEAAARTQEGGCAGERFDVTAGYRPHEDWLAMAQVFTDAPRDGETALQGQITLVRFGTEGRGLQFGVRTRLDGGAREGALVLGFWGRPGE